MKIFDWTQDINTLFAEIPIPNDLIICDSCNMRIGNKKVPLLIEITDDPEVQLVCQALCYNYVNKYYSNYIHIGNPE